MKKLKFLIFVFLFLLIAFILFAINKNTLKDEKEESLPFKEILDEINLASNQNFMKIYDNEIHNYIPVTFSKYDNLLYAVNDTNKNEYFLIGKNLENNQKEELERLYSNANEDFLIFYFDKNYMYAIKSEEYLYMIEGIITSFINNYNNENK